MNIHDMALKEGLKVEVSNINFHYPDQEHNILENASLTIEDGEKIIILGDGSAGKTTFLYLLNGLYKVQDGTIAFNELPIGNLNPLHLRSLVGNCLLDELLFEGTILENITMGRKNIPFENVKWIVENLGLTNFIKSLPEGYNTHIHARGKTFSRGKIDKLILARALVGNPKLILIKDSFTTLKPAERERIFSFLTDKANHWTLVISTSDEGLKAHVDRTVILKDGSFTELNK
jgi:ABC-type bacteriocin/lantibiotic exporter with double-glycine peptidase domain